MDSEYYCGLPQNQWDILAEQAEEILRDQEYGQHILGLYPAGSRIYGIESSSPSLLCLYVDTVDSLIDPSEYSHKLRIESVGNSDSKIYFVELYEWAKWLLEAMTTSCGETLLPMLPAVQDIFYEDESIASIVSIAKEMILAHGPGCPKHEKPALQVRTQVILKLRNTFSPCVNEDLGIVVGLDELGIKIPDYILEFDKKIIDTYLGLSSTNSPYCRSFIEMENQYIMYLNSICPEKKDNKWLEQWKLLGKEIANLYRYQL